MEITTFPQVRGYFWSSFANRPDESLSDPQGAVPLLRELSSAVLRLPAGSPVAQEGVLTVRAPTAAGSSKGEMVAVMGQRMPRWMEPREPNGRRHAEKELTRHAAPGERPSALR